MILCICFRLWLPSIVCILIIRSVSAFSGVYENASTEDHDEKSSNKANNYSRKWSVANGIPTKSVALSEQVAMKSIRMIRDVKGPSSTLAPMKNENDANVTKHYGGYFILKPSDEAKAAVHNNGKDHAGPGGNNSDHRSPRNKRSSGSHHGSGIQLASLRWEYVEAPFFYTALVLVAGVCKLVILVLLLLSFSVFIILGVLVGLLLYATQSIKFEAHDTIKAFFLYFLPPIVLESAYSLHDNTFFDNLGTILLYAIVGTLLNAFTIGPSLYFLSWSGMLKNITSIPVTETLVFSSLVSAVDPVTVLAIFQEIGVKKELYFLVFGESLFNDAVTIVLYNMMMGFTTLVHITPTQVVLGVASFFTVSGGALLIGIIIGVLSAIFTKYTRGIRVLEPLAVLGCAYFSYVLAELFHFSGIISIVCCGLIQAEYCWANISQKSYVTVKYFTKMLAAISDTVIFLFLGIVLVNDSHEWHTQFILSTVGLSLVYRFAAVFGLTFLANHFERAHTINMEEQFIMSYGGLRGAVSFSLAIMLDKELIGHKDLFVTTTVCVILFTIFVQVIDHLMEGVEEITGYRRGAYLKILSRINEKYLKKWLQVDERSYLSRVYTKVVLAEHFANLYGHPEAGSKKKHPKSLKKHKTSIKVMNSNEMIEMMPSKEAPHDDEKSSSEGDETIVPLRNKAPDRRLANRAKFASLQIPDEIAKKTEARTLKRRYTEGSIPLRLRSAKGDEQKEEEEDYSKTLVRAIDSNPFKKYYQRCNRNLVNDENQEIIALLKARHQRARRRTCTDIGAPIFPPPDDVPETDLDDTALDVDIVRRGQPCLYRNIPGRRRLRKANTIAAGEPNIMVAPNQRNFNSHNNIALVELSNQNSVTFACGPSDTDISDDDKGSVALNIPVHT